MGDRDVDLGDREHRVTRDVWLVGGDVGWVGHVGG